MTAPTVTGDRLALVVGSSLAEDALAAGARAFGVETPFGPVSLLEHVDVVIVNRHHTTGAFVPAHHLDHHRTIAGLCAAGVDRVVALGSVGSLRDWPVGTFLAPFDLYAPQVNPTFHTDALGHSVPGFHEGWRDVVLAEWEAVTGASLVDGGVYAQTTGPRFETPAEVRALAQHADVVGMTLASECILAREAGLAYAAVCIVDNLGNGLADRPLTVDEFREGVARNRARLLADLEVVLPHLAAVGRPDRG